MDAVLCPVPPEDFVGREVDMWRVVSLFAVRRLVTLEGAAGVGKSAVASAVAQYLSARDFFPHGILFVRLRQRGTSVHRLVELIEDALVAQARAKGACAFFFVSILQWRFG